MQTTGRTSLDRARLLAVVVAVVVADQLTKLAVVRGIPEGNSVRAVDDILVFSHIRNTGAAFGTLRGFGGVLALVALAAVVIFVGFVLKRPSFWTGIAVALVAGGALGNLLDRLTRGSVVDFIDFKFWPAFNVADSAVSVGAVLLLLVTWNDRSARTHRKTVSEPRPDTGGDATDRGA